MRSGLLAKVGFAEGKITHRHSGDALRFLSEILVVIEDTDSNLTAIFVLLVQKTVGA